MRIASFAVARWAPRLVCLTLFCAYGARAQFCRELGSPGGESAAHLRTLSDGRIPVVFHVASRAVSMDLDDERLRGALAFLGTRYPEEFDFTLDRVDRDEGRDAIELTDENRAALLRRTRLEKNFGKVNVFIVDAIPDTHGTFCGMATYPDQRDQAVFISWSCSTQASRFEGILTHELGHFFGLPHTHEGWGTAKQESVAACAHTGDLFCDTPPDPDLTSYRDRIRPSFEGGASRACAWTGAAPRFFDADRTEFFPDVDNAMSYAPAECLLRFSEQQRAALARGLLRWTR